MTRGQRLPVERCTSQVDGRLTLATSIGGWRGLVESSLPATAFVLVRGVTGGIAVPGGAAVLVVLTVAVLRRAHGLSPRQAWNGLFGLLVALVAVRATGTGEGLFLPGIVMTALLGVLFAGTLLVGRPFVALALARYDPKWAAWRDHAALRRACVVATGVWAATFLVRSGVATWIYQRPGDADGTLLLVVNGVKWPLMVGASLLTVLLVRRAGPVPQRVHITAAERESAGANTSFSREFT